MAADEMKKNVEKLDELEESLKKAQEELIVRFVPLITSVYETNDHNLFCLIGLKGEPLYTCIPKVHPDLTPLHPCVIVHIFHTVFSTFPYMLTRKICLTIKSFSNWESFPLFS